MNPSAILGSVVLAASVLTVGAAAQGAAKDEFSTPRWEIGRPLMQGFIGVTEYSKVESDGTSGIDGDKGDLDSFPLIGGGAQWKLGGDRVDLGIEGFFGLSGEADAAAFVVGGGGAVVAVDVDLLLVDIYGGPFASVFLGERWRLYGSAGPLLEFADYEQSGSGGGSESAFGYGLYARSGLEFYIPHFGYLGFGARWSNSEVDLGGDFGDLEIDGLQLMVTVSR